MSPPPLSISIEKAVTTTISEGLTMFANSGLTSAPRREKSTSSTGRQASFRSLKTRPSSISMTRCSVGVKSRPSTLAAKRPLPPKKRSTTL